MNQAVRKQNLFYVCNFFFCFISYTLQLQTKPLITQPFCVLLLFSWMCCVLYTTLPCCQPYLCKSHDRWSKGILNVSIRAYSGFGIPGGCANSLPGQRRSFQALVNFSFLLWLCSIPHCEASALLTWPGQNSWQIMTGCEIFYYVHFCFIKKYFKISASV